MMASAGLTIVNKSLYNKFGFKNPMNLFFCQCIVNFAICMTLMSWKTFISPNGFKKLEDLGFRITTFNETFQKLSMGFRVGAMYNTTILFGIYAVKLIPIPMFLTFRRCAIISTVIVQYVLENTIPN